MSTPLADFYKSTLSQDWSIGTGNFYVALKPTTTEGWLVISPSSDTLREIVKYTSTGTDANGDYVVISERGCGVTTEQPHTQGEKIRLNLTSLHWEEMRDDIDSIVVAGAPNASTTERGIVQEATQTQITDGTDIGDTSAKLFVTPSKMNVQIDVKIDNLGQIIELEAGEDILSKDSVAISSGSGSLLFATGNTGPEHSNNSYIAQTFLTPNINCKITSLKISTDSYSSGTSSGTVSIYSTSAGVPTGSPLVTSASYNLSGLTTISISNCPLLSLNTTYAIVWHYTSIGEYQVNNTSSSYYANGNMYTSSDGISWTSYSTKDVYLTDITLTLGESGKIYKTDANINGSTATELTNNFIGFAKSNIIKGQSGEVYISGSHTVSTGLTIGKDVYLSDTPGVVSSSAGTVSRKIGIAINPTDVLIKNDNI